MRWICGILLLALLYLHVGCEYANHYTPYGGYQHYQQPAPPQQIHVVPPQEPHENTRQTVRLQIEVVTPRNRNNGGRGDNGRDADRDGDDGEDGEEEPPRGGRPNGRPTGRRPRQPIRVRPDDEIDQVIEVELPPGVQLAPPQRQPFLG